MATYGLLIDYEYCTNCGSCQVSCKEEHGYPVGKTGISVHADGPWKIERGVRKLRGRHGACVCGRRRGANGCTVGGAFGGGGVFAGRVVGRSWFVGGGRGAVRRGVHVGFGRGRL